MSATSGPGQFSLPNLNVPAAESLTCSTAKSSPKPMADLSVILDFHTPYKGGISVLARVDESAGEGKKSYWNPRLLCKLSRIQSFVETLKDEITGEEGAPIQMQAFSLQWLYPTKWW